MAKVLYGAIVTAMTGKVGGQIFQNNASGAILKNRPRAPKHSSVYSQNHRQIVGSIASGWKSLGSTLQAEWLAACPSFVVKDRLGGNRTPQPFQLYMANNIKSWYSNEQYNTSPGTPPSINYVFACDNLTVSISSGITFDLIPGIASTQSLVVFFSRSQGLGVRSPKGGYKYINSWQGADGGTYDVTTEYVKIYGHPILNGNIFMYYKIYDLSTGISNPPQYLTAQVTS